MICKTSIGAMHSNNHTCHPDCTYLGRIVILCSKHYTCFRFHKWLTTKNGKPRICLDCLSILELCRAKKRIKNKRIST